MKKFLYNLIAFSIIILVINMLLYLIVYSIYFKPYQKNDLKGVIFLFSDSHGAALGNLSNKLNIYNYSMGSDSYEDIYNKIEYLIQNYNVKKILITSDDHMLSTYRDRMNNRDRSYYFRSLFEDNSMSEKINIINNKYLKRYFPIINAKSRDIILSFFKSKIKSKKKYHPVWNEFSQKKRINKAKERFYFQFKNHKISKLQSKYLEKIIDICNKNSIRIIAIKFPISKEYNLVMGDFSFNSDSIFRDNNIKILDYKQLYLNDSSFFYDQDHLNKKGSVHFINHLKKELNE